MKPSVIYDDPGPRWVWLLMAAFAVGIVLAYCMSPVREREEPTWTPQTIAPAVTTSVGGPLQEETRDE